MKSKILIILCTSFLSIKAQFDCTQGRFVDQTYFDSVSVVPDVLFGSNLNVANTSFQDLYLALVSHWANPESIVNDGYEPITILNEKNGCLQEYNQIQKMMILDLMTYTENLKPIMGL